MFNQYIIFILLVLSSNVFACEQYIAYQKGTIPVLLSSPHGADTTRLLPGVPPRTGGHIEQGFVNRADQFTDVLTWRVGELLMEKGLKPYIVVAGINRSQIDFNRAPDQAYESEEAAPCYHYYHEALKKVIADIRQQWGAGFILDVHGQSRYDYDILRGTRNKQTIQQLIRRYERDVTEEEEGFFTILRESARYSIHPDKGKKERYYYGGFTLMQYGSHRESGIDALQVEVGRKIRINENSRELIAQDLAEAIGRFYHRYYLK